MPLQQVHIALVLGGCLLQGLCMLLLLALAGMNLVYPKPMPKTQLTLAFGAPTLQFSLAPPPTSALHSRLLTQ